MRLDDLPPDLIIDILDHLPMLDYYPLRLTGSRYLTDTITDHCQSRISRGKYLQAIQGEDARRRKAQGKPARRALELMIARGQSALVYRFRAAYNTPNTTNNNTSDERKLEYHAGRRTFPRYNTTERRSFRLALHWAVYYGINDIVQLLIDRIHRREGKHGRTPLFYAVLGRQIKLAEILLDHGAYINALDNKGKTPLALATELGDDAMIAFLRSRGAYLDLYEMVDARVAWTTLVFRDQCSSSSSSSSSSSGGLEEVRKAVAQYLPETLRLKPPLRQFLQYRRRQLEKGPGLGLSAEQIVARQTKIMLGAIHAGDRVIVSASLDAGFDVNRVLSRSRWRSLTALHLATRRESKPLITLLLRRGADLTFTSSYTYWKCSAVQVAVLKRRLDLIQLFLDAGVSLDVRNSAGQTSLHLAARLHDEGMMGYLLAQGADLEAKDNKGNTPLHATVWGEEPDALRYLIQRGADVDARNNQNRTALHRAATNPVPRGGEGVGAIKALVEEGGADMEVRAVTGLTPLLACIGSQGSDKKIECLAGLGADPKARTDAGYAALHLVCHITRLSSQRSTTAAEALALITAGADVNARDRTGLTPLHHSLLNIGAHHEYDRLLVTHGADVHATDETGTTPLHLAMAVDLHVKPGREILWRSGGEEQVAKSCLLLLEQGADPFALDHCGRAPIHVLRDSYRGKGSDVHDTLVQLSTGVPDMHEKVNAIQVLRGLFETYLQMWDRNDT